MTPLVILRNTQYLGCVQKLTIGKKGVGGWLGAGTLEGDSAVTNYYIRTTNPLLT